MTLDEFTRHWEQVHAALLTTMRKFSDDELLFAPFPNAYSAAQLMLHIAHEEEIEIHYGITREWSEAPPPFSVQQYPRVEAIILVLNETRAHTEYYLSTLTDVDMTRRIETPWGTAAPLSELLWHVLEHEIHHRGELSLILGLLGHKGLDV
jgi:uncharacterized damage-inducible protein DinB